MARLLVVDDEKGLRITMQEFLRAEGHDVDTAASAAEALALFETVDYDVVVADIILPEMDGIAMLGWIRDRCPDTSVIMITGEPTFETAAQAVRAGAFDYLPKPVSRERLVDVVARASRVALLEKENRAHRERLESLVRERTAELRESERRYRLLAENATDVIFTMDLELVPTYVSPSITRLRGWTVDEAMRLTPERNIAPASLELARRLLAEELFAEDGADPGRTRRLELELTCADGSTVWHEVTLTFVRDEEGRPTGIEGVSRDVAERRRAEGERRALEEQLRQSQKMEAMGRLAGGVAHDFNNLLSAILGYTSLLKTQVAGDSSLWPDLDEIERAGQKAANLTRQLLAFSRKEIIKPEVLGLNDVVSDMDKMLRRVIGEDVVLVTLLSPDLDPVRADRGHVEQVIMNLAVNARDAMPAGGRLEISTANVSQAEVSVHLDPDMAAEGYVRLGVGDTGTGMDPGVAERVFEPFFTTKKQGRGTGLGLSTVYGIVKQAGGEIGLETRPGQGTRFDVFLPACLEGGPEARSTDDGAPQVRGKGTVLVVEDEDAVRVLVRRMLERRGFSVLEARGGNEALKVSGRHEGEISLLLTDVIMPGMSGRELAGRLGRSRPGMRVLFMSGYTDDVIAEQGVLLDGVELVQKPFDSEELLARIARLLGQES